MKSSICCVWVVVLLTAYPCAPASEPATRQCEVGGEGQSQQAAIADGLVQAIQQVNGVSLKQKSISQAKYLDEVTELKDAFNSSTVSSEDIQTVSHGIVDGYEILSRHDDPQTRMVRLQLRVRLLVYEADHSGQRKAIAVLPFRSAQPSYRIFGADYSADRLREMLSQGLVEGLAQSRKFTLIDRDFLTELFGEQKLMQTMDMPVKELVKLEQLRGADYLLVGKIDDVDAGFDVSGAQTGPRHAKISVSYRVLDLATGEDHWAESFHRTYNDNDLNNLPPVRRGLRIEETLIADATADISDQIVWAVFPIPVLDVDGPDVTLGQGGKSIGIKDELDVFNLGRELFDPANRQSLGRAERLVARVRVERVTNKMTFARVVSGDPARIRPEHAICRRHIDALSKYVRHPDATDNSIVAVAVVDTAAQFNAEVGHTISQQLSTRHVKARSDFFSNALIADGIFDHIFSGAANDILDLGFARSCAYIVLVHRTSDLVVRPDLQRMITGRGSLDIRVVRTVDGECVDQFLVSANTSEFIKEKAEARLNEKLAQEVANHGFGEWVSSASASAGSRAGQKDEGN